MAAMPDPAARTRQVRRVLRLVLWMNLAVIVMKVVVFMMSHALSVLAESMHSTLDAANNVFALAMARVAGQAPDEDHPYGHTKFETLGALALVGALSITVFELMRNAVVRLLAHSVPVANIDGLTLGIMGASLLAGIFIARYESRLGKRLGSDLILADAAHTRSDVLTTLAVLVGLVAIRAGHPMADPVATLIVAVLIARTGWEIVRGAVPVLVDERAVEPQRIQRLVMAVEGVRSAYGIRSRGRPGAVFAELTIAVDPDLDVATSHRIADETERSVTDALGANEVVVPVEPVE